MGCGYGEVDEGYRLRMELDSLESSRRRANVDVNDWEGRVSSLGSQLNARNQALQAAVALWDDHIAKIETLDASLLERLKSLGTAVGTGMNEVSTYEGVPSKVGTPASDVAEAHRLCQSLIDRLNSEITNLNTQLTTAESNAQSARNRRDSLTSSIAETKDALEARS